MTDLPPSYIEGDTTDTVSTLQDTTRLCQGRCGREAVKDGLCDECYDSYDYFTKYVY